jgi:hypothetical protein
MVDRAVDELNEPSDVMVAERVQGALNEEGGLGVGEGPLRLLAIRPRLGAELVSMALSLREPRVPLDIKFLPSILRERESDFISQRDERDK